MVEWELPFRNAVVRPSMTSFLPGPFGATGTDSDGRGRYARSSCRRRYGELHRIGNAEVAWH